MAQHYEISDLGEIQSYLGIQISRDRQNKRLTIDQSGYVKDVLERFGMADANPHHTPLPAGADMHLVKYNLQASASDINTIKASLAACFTYKLALVRTFPLLYHVWHSMQQIPHLIIYASRNMSSPIDRKSVV